MAEIWGHTYFPKGLGVTDYCFTASCGSPFKKTSTQFLGDFFIEDFFDGQGDDRFAGAAGRVAFW